MADEQKEQAAGDKVGWLVEIFQSSRFRVVLAGIVAITWIVTTLIEEKTESPGVLSVALRAIYTIGGVVGLHILLRTISKWKNGRQEDTGGSLPGAEDPG